MERQFINHVPFASWCPFCVGFRKPNHHRRRCKTGGREIPLLVAEYAFVRNTQDVVLLNLWSLGHFVQWTFIGRYLLTNWWVFLALSVGWEVLELYLPFEFVEETWDNKLSDLVVNTVGFAIGLGLRYDPQTLD